MLKPSGHHVSHWAVVLLMAILGLGVVGGAPLRAGEDNLRLPVTADDSICCDKRELDFNQGAKSRIKLKGIENIILLNFDAAPIRGRMVKKAVLHIRGVDDRMMVRHIGFSTVATDWAEGKQSDGKAGVGEPCFLTPAVDSKRLWAGPGSTFADCFGGRSGTIWAQTYVAKDKDLWYAMEIDPRIVEACAAGLSHGICMTDDNGQTARAAKSVVKDGNQGNNWFFSREQKISEPYITVELEPRAPAMAAAPAALAVAIRPWQAGADTETGAAEIAWPGPPTSAEAVSVLGYRIVLSINGGPMTALPRWQIPAPGPAGEPVRALIRGLKPGVALKAQVEQINRGAWIAVMGSAEGAASASFPEPTALVLPQLTIATGAPPTAEGSTVWVMPDCAKANPITGNVLEEAGVDYEGDSAGKYAQGNSIWSGATRTVRLHSLRGEWVAFQVVCQNKDGAAMTYALQPGDLTGPDGARIPATAFELAWLWYQHAGKTDRGWYADPMAPLKAGVEIAVPNKQNAVPGQQNQTVYIELFVPKDARPGRYSGSLQVTVGKSAIPLTVELDVASASIPIETHFVYSLNNYFSPGEEYGAPESDECLAALHAFYKFCHTHRTELALMNYGHRSDHDPGTAPAIAGVGKEARVKDWTDWDRRFGPLLDGSLFNGTPREGTVLDHFMVNFCEDYPASMKAYKYNDVLWEDHWKVCGPVAESFPQEYKDTWVAVAKDYIRHVQEKKYRTSLQVLLNNKYYYKQFDEKKKKYGKGTSFWLLDEPQHIDDYSALAFYGDLLKLAQNGDRKTLCYRVDVSRPQWGRTLLDRVTDLNISGGFSQFPQLLEDWRERYGQVVWTYGGNPTSMESALAIEAQGLDLYSRGVDGYVPAEALSNANAWTTHSWAAIVYSGKAIGVPGPCASLRLKAYRRSQQDVEYLRLLAEKRGLLKNDPNRRQLARLMAGLFKNSRQAGVLDAEGAVTEILRGQTPDDFERLRRAIAAELK